MMRNPTESSLGCMRSKSGQKLAFIFYYTKIPELGSTLVIRGKGTLKLIRDRFKTNKREHLFMQHVIKLWNSFPSEVAEAGSIASSKMELDQFMDDRLINNC